MLVGSIINVKASRKNSHFQKEERARLSRYVVNVVGQWLNYGRVCVSFNH